MRKILSDASKELFPISTINSLLTLFENEFTAPAQQNKEVRQNNEDGGNRTESSEPNLALLSIVLGSIEHSLTFPTTSSIGNSGIKKQHRCSRILKHTLHSQGLKELDEHGSNVVGERIINTTSEYDFPPLELDIVLGMYDKFKAIVFSAVNLDLYNRDKSTPEGTSRELVKNISDIFWNTLSRNYLSDRPHLQTLYSYLNGNKLDSFGLALAVVAGCQTLGLDDVHLVLSEDHVWVTFGKGEQKHNNNAEVTWHGKGGEDRRGRPIEDSPSWLYLKGFPVMCNRWTEIAVIVSSINKSINGSLDSLEMGLIQQKLLWKLYNHGHLERYPMAIGHLADLEEATVTPNVKSCFELFEESISSSKCFYNNMHVYPYIYYGGYLYRREDYKGALKYWSEAAQVISNYRYCKLDEEIYKEFLEISKELLTSMMKKCSTGFSANSPTRDPNCYADLLKFFDGICLWEELGRTPVLHITWAKCWISSLGKFEYIAKEGIKLFDSNDDVPKLCDVKLHLNCDILMPTERSTSSTGFMDMNGNQNGKDGPLDDDESPKVHLYFKSFKMKSIKTLLQKEKFNPATLSLQLTAQPTLLPMAAESSGIPVFGGRNRGMKSKGQEESPLPDESLTSLKTKRRRRN